MAIVYLYTINTVAGTYIEEGYDDVALETIYKMWGKYTCMSLLYTANAPSRFLITLISNTEVVRRDRVIAEIDSLIVDTVTII